MTAKFRLIDPPHQINGSGGCHAENSAATYFAGYNATDPAATGHSDFGDQTRVYMPAVHGTFESQIHRAYVRRSPGIDWLAVAQIGSCVGFVAFAVAVVMGWV